MQDKKIAIIGAGGIGFDVAEYLVHDDRHNFYETWGIDTELEQRGGLNTAENVASNRTVHMLQRSSKKMGSGLGKTTGWTHRLTLQRRGVKMMNAIEYRKIDDAGLHITVNGKPDILEVDTVIICAGQEPLRELHDALEAKGASVELIGGAYEAAELDAKAAIKQASELAAKI